MNRAFLRPCLSVFLASMLLVGCSNEDDKEFVADTASFFKIGVSTEAYGDNELTTRAASVSADTIITPLDNGLLMETIVNQNTPAEASTRATRAGNMDAGTQVSILVYKSGTCYGTMQGVVQADGSVQIQDEPIALPAGTYDFVCVANGTLDGYYSFIAKSGQNSLVSSVLTKTINAGDQSCILSFNMKHRVSQIKVTVTTTMKNENFTGLTASLSASSAYPMEEKLSLPLCDVRSYQNLGNLNREIISNATGNITTPIVSQLPNYFIGSENSRNLWNLCQMKLTFTAGQFGITPLAGKSIDLTTLAIKDNQISNVTINIKGSYTVRFRSQNEAQGTVSETELSGSLNNQFAVEAQRTTGNSFSGWYDEAGTLVSTQEVFTGTFNTASNGKTYTARFKIRTADDLPYTLAPGNLRYESGVYSFSTANGKWGGDDIINEKWQLMMLEPGFHTGWYSVNQADYRFGDPCSRMGDGKWYTPSPEQLLALKETGWEFEVGVGKMIFNKNAPGKEIYFYNARFLNPENGVYVDNNSNLNGILYRTKDANNDYSSPYMISLQTNNGKTDWVIYKRTYAYYNVSTAAALRCVRNK